MDCEDYRVYNDLLIRNGNYTTQVDHIVISRYSVLCWRPRIAVKAALF
ncbi:MAG: nuclease-related domain-containing protein [Bacteroidales bacterium]|nr:nuclease-related domain-containing protein [Bacteroidales bacterium]MDY6001612.1 nuclease-related domain-containing protein [Candidatus Cryptobacteroides sp.]